MTLSGYIERLSVVETAIVALVARVAPWLPPLPTAWLVYDRCMRYLGWPRWTGAAAGVAVECLGLLVTLTALELYSYNRAKLKSEPAAPLFIPLALSAVYLVVAELLTLGLDLAPRLVAGEGLTIAMLAPACFPPLSLVGMVLLAVRHDQRMRLAENAAAAARRRQVRAERRADSESKRQELRREAAESEGLRDLERQRLLLLREVFAPGVRFTRAEAEPVVGLQSTAAGRLLTTLVAADELQATGDGRQRSYQFEGRD